MTEDEEEEEEEAEESIETDFVSRLWSSSEFSDLSARDREQIHTKKPDHFYFWYTNQIDEDVFFMEKQKQKIEVPWL